ncbi:MAG: porin [Elusimicrobiota bacterium]|nr:porin [Elusimicrobiota bacterium]
MKLMIRTVAAAALLGALLPSAHGLTIVDNGKLKMDLHGRGQMIGVGQIVPDPVRDHGRVYLFMKQSRLGVSGMYDDVKYETQFSFGGESANGSNTDLGMLDFVADIPVAPMGENGSLKVGQFRVPYSREGLTDRGYMNFGERSLANLASYQTRDYGLALQKYSGNFAGTLGIFSGGGRDVPQRYLPERLGWPETVLRVGYNDGIDEDIYHVKGTDIELKRSGKAVFFNALYMQDTLIGHNAVANLRTIDKNLLIDSNYNPFIGAGPAGAAANARTQQRGNIWFVGGDAVVRRLLGNGHILEAEVEGNWGGYQNRYGSLHIGNARGQVAYTAMPYQIGVRYAALFMDKNANYLTGGKRYSPSLGSTVHEVAPSLTWYIKKHHLKLVADAPIYLNMPVFVEPGVGAYVFADQPGQVTYLQSAGGNVKRHAVFTGRMLLQFMF